MADGDVMLPAVGTWLRRADGGIAFDAIRRDGRTVLGRLRQDAPCRAFFPHPTNPKELNAILVNTGGGLVEGDRIATALTVQTGAQLHVTSQAAEKVYRALTQTCVVTSSFDLADHATAFWLPHETILFDGARLSRQQSVNLTATSRFLAAEVVVFGRIMRGERLNYGQLHDSWSVWRDRKLLWRDALRLDGDFTRHRARSFGFGNAVGYATVFYYGPDAATFLPLARDIATSYGGAATLVNQILLARFLSEDEALLRAAVANLGQALRAAVTAAIATVSP